MVYSIRNALKGAANILINTSCCFPIKQWLLKTVKAEEEEQLMKKLHMRKLLKTPLTDLDLSVRAYKLS